MALEFDGFEAWHAIAESPETFASLRAEASKSARAALTRYLKGKAVGLPELRSVRKALSKQTFGLLVDGMKDAELKTLVTRLDRHHPELKTSSPEWRRQHLRQLVRGEAEPAAKSAKPAKSGKTGKSSRGPKKQEPQGDWFTSAGAVRKR